MKLRRALTRVAFISFSMILVISAPRSVAAQEVPDFLVTSRSAHSFDDTLDLLRQAIAGQNLMLINEVNPQQMLRMVGVTTGGMRQIFSSTRGIWRRSSNETGTPVSCPR